MRDSHQWIFGPFRLETATIRLWCGETPVTLPPKAFDVLHYLVTHPDRLVTKDELLDAVWPATAVTDAVVRVAIGTLRQALGDRVQTPRYIATVSRRGYRFLAPVTLYTSSASSPVLPLPPRLAPTPPLLVERDTVLTQLHTHLARAQQGTRQVVLVTGEPGIGKTAVVEAFAAQAAHQGTLWMAQGQCVESYGAHEAYQPVLEALAHLCRVPEGGQLVALLRQYAPTWLVQMPWLLTEADRSHLQHELHGATRERMLREFAELVDTLTAETTLLLVLEDLHWSDYATVDLLAMLARRRTAARLLVVGTYRPGEAMGQDHPLRAVVQELPRYGQSTELALAALSPTAVVAYLAARCPDHHFPAALARWLHTHTEGNALFVVTLMQALVARGTLAIRDGNWTMQGALEALDAGVPETLRHVIEQQCARVPPEAQRVLAVASVAGVTFATTTVAAGLRADVEMVETACATLARWQLVREVGMVTSPDATVTTRYAFMHALYQQVTYERLGLGQRVQLHQRLGTYLEVTYGPQAVELAAELAVHFERGHDLPRAVQYLQQAAANATQRYAYREVVDLLTRALALLGQLPETPERSQQELEIQLTLGPVLMATEGHAAPEVEQTYDRARVLCQQMGETPQLLPTLHGLCRFYHSRGAYPLARELAEQLYRLAQRQSTRTPRLEAHDALGTTLFYQGEFVAARAHLEQGIALIDLVAQRTRMFHDSETPGVKCLVIAAHTLWCLGYPTQAVQRIQEAVVLAQALAHPYSVATAQHYASLLYYRCREALAVQAQAEALLSLATTQGFLVRAGFGTFWRGCALAMQGQHVVGTTHMQQGMAAIVATGVGSRPLCLVVLAEVAGHTGQSEAGLHLLAEALTALEASGRGDLLAEAYRLQGVLLLQQSTPDAVQAAACFRQALAVARRQQAKAWELRAATSLARLWQQQGKRTAARQLLAEVFGWFTEGFDTADLQEAKALLEELGG